MCFHKALVVQARPVLNTDPPRPLIRLLPLRQAHRPVYPVDAATQPHLLRQRAHGLRCHLLQSFMAMPATEACAMSAAPLSQGTGDCALSAAPPVTGACVSGAAPLSQGPEPVF